MKTNAEMLAEFRAEGQAELRPPLRLVAEQLFEANHIEALAEERVSNVLFFAFGDGWTDYSADYYDESIEVFGSDLTAPSAPEALSQAGFSLAWLHAPECEHPRGNGCKCQPISLRHVPRCP